MCVNSKAILQKNAQEEETGPTRALPIHKLSLSMELPLLLPQPPLMLRQLLHHKSNKDMLSTSLPLSSNNNMVILCCPRTVYHLLTPWESHQHLRAPTIKQAPPV